MKATRVLRGYRRTIVCAGIATAAILLATPGLSAGAPRAAAVEPGQGLAIAQTTRVDPRAGALSIGVLFGTSIAGHQNRDAQASSQAINLGVIGTTLAGEGCSGGDPTLPADQQPQPLQVDSRDEGASTGLDETEDGAFRKQVRATADPYSEAITTTGGFGIAGVMEIGGGTARTFSGVVNGQREAHAFADISGIKFPLLAGLGLGIVELSGLHWEAVHRSTGSKLVEGSFSIGSAKIAGQAIPTNDPNATIAQLNTVLAPVGLQIQPPIEREAGGVVFVDPMGISVVPNAARDALSNAIFDGIQPIRENLFAAILEIYCSASTEITVFDIVIGSVSGAGSFNINLGGVQASSGEITDNGFDLGLGDGFTPTLPSGGDVSGGGALDTGGDTTTPTIAPAADGGDEVEPDSEEAASVVPEGERGGWLAGIGLGSLLMLMGVAEGDRRKMRRAQREIPVLDH